jgi:hypothetical protein
MNLEARRKANVRWGAGCVLIVLLQTACAEPAGIATREALADPAALDPSLASLAAEARTDLAQRLSVDGDDIDVIAARYVTWPDSSAGCPKPGFEYLQVQTEGALISLRAAGRTYQYHSAGGQPPFLCETPSKVTPRPSGPFTE